MRPYTLYKIPPPPEALTDRFPSARQLDTEWMIYSAADQPQQSYNVDMVTYMEEQQALDPNLDYKQVFYDEMNRVMPLNPTRNIFLNLYQAQLWVQTYEVSP